MNLEQCWLNDSFEVFAHWWLPEAPTDRVPGTLTFSPQDGANLDLQGTFNQPAFSDIPTMLSARLPEFERIFGERPNGQKITLQHTVGMACSAGTWTFHCQFVFAGGHVAAGVLPNPAIGYLEYDQLEEWSCFRLLQSFHDGVPGRITYQLPSGPVRLLSIPKSDYHPTLSLVAIASQTLTSDKATFERRVNFEVAFENVEFASILNFANDIAQLLTILTSRPANLARCVCTFGPERGVSVFFQRVRGAPSGRISAHNMPLPLLDLGEKAVEVFSKWLGSTASMRPVYSMYFSMIFNDASYIDTKFQALVQSIEGFHRRMYGGRYLEASDYSQLQDKLVNAIPQSTDSHLRERLKNAVRYANEYSLRKRLKEIINSLQPRTRNMLSLDSSFQSDVIDTRNYYAHLDDASKTRYVGDGVAMYGLNQRLSALFQILVLTTLGISESAAATAIVKHGVSLA